MRPTSRVLTAALLAAIIVIPASASGTDAGVRKVALGVSMADNQSLEAVDAYTSSVGRAPALLAVWNYWGGSNTAFPSSFMDGLRARGIVPMVNWGPVDPDDVYNCSQWSLNNIVNGDHDAYIQEWATAAAAHGGRVILRFAHEMNGEWFPWGAGRCTNSPAEFVTAWRHVWDIFMGTGATNVKFLWSVYGARNIAAFYPGDGYVDYVGLTAFNWGPSGSSNNQPWRTMVANFQPSMKALMRLTKKPIIAAEMGAADVPGCGACNKAKYITKGYPAVRARWPRLVAMVYFNLDMRHVGQPNWLLDSPAGAMTAYRAIVAKPKFQGTIP